VLDEQQVGRGDGELCAAAVVFELRAHGQPRAGVAGEVVADVTRPPFARSRDGAAGSCSPRAPGVMRARVADVVSFS
jgi:hypothetical protein